MRGLALSLVGLVLTSGLAEAQQYPVRPVEMIIPFTAGSGLDVNGRAVATSLSNQLKQPVFVKNRDGAAGTIGFGDLASAPADGYTLGFGPTTPIANAPHLMSGVKYDSNSFSYICQIFETFFVVAAGPQSRFKTIAEVLQAAKEKPKSVTYGTAGLGSVPHLAMANLGQALGLEFQHVPYRGEGALLPALLGNDIDLAVLAVATVREQPAIRALAIFDDARNDAYPDAPTVKELGVARGVPPGQVGIFAPQGLPAEVQETLSTACAATARDPEVLRVINTTGQRAKYLTGAQYRQLTIDDYKFKGDLIKSLGLLNR
jgi:tripartite-type tricarboxylate transporter receptor subunit TctC